MDDRVHDMYHVKHIATFLNILCLVSKAYSGISRTWQDNAVLQYDLPSTTIAPYGSYVLCHEANNNPRCDAKLRSNGVPSKTFNIRGNDAVALSK